jgi:HSP90 family molecular chaperone
LNITQEKRRFAKHGIKSSVKFSVANNAHVMNLLSSSLYSDKIAAPIRELSANAVDAHYMAGNQRRPFEIHLPTYAEPSFTIRDYGTGMPREHLETLYTTYCIS